MIGRIMSRPSAAGFAYITTARMHGPIATEPGGQPAYRDTIQRHAGGVVRVLSDNQFQIVLGPGGRTTGRWRLPAAA